MTVKQLIDQAEERFDPCAHWQKVGHFLCSSLEETGHPCEECDRLNKSDGPRLYRFEIGKTRREVYESAIVEKPEGELTCSGKRGYYWVITIKSSKGLRDAAKRAIEKTDRWRSQ